ncbi:hypothetical protein HYPSUDRAFT_791988 [Hypholoma sublateritium FD-334 SS-4]|uniref:Uncharacterized protein n=1 Tax=Hypholoma sublateritium (strain FD-334 SS-4) TaxID=945553 RepID=A0A0D2PAQ0_HYPSF|nr:hypothetical protein HYPSUDRAFT_791988 [Hypholoma sublateritium FD-334 SS-4]
MKNEDKMTTAQREAIVLVSHISHACRLLLIAIQKDPEVVVQLDLIKKEHGMLLETLSPEPTRDIRPTTGSINLLMAAVRSAAEDSVGPRIIPGLEEEAYRHEQEALSLLAQLVKIKAHQKRILTMNERQETTRSYEIGSLTGTVLERKEAAAEAKKLPKSLMEAAQSVTGKFVLPLCAVAQSPFSVPDSISVLPDNLADMAAWGETANIAIEEARQDLEEDEEDYEATKACQRLVNMVGGSTEDLFPEPHPEDETTEEITSQLPSLEQTELNEVDVLNMPILNLRWALMVHLYTPVVEQEEFDKTRVSANQFGGVCTNPFAR